jgi:hypothetical protein
MVTALAVVVTVTGCGVVDNSKAIDQTFDEAKAQALSLVNEVGETLPAKAIVGSSDDEVRIACGDDAAQYDGIRTVSVSPEFDRTAWLDATADAFEKKEGWTVQKKVAADGSSEATSAVSLVSADGYYMRLGEFAETPEGGPVIVLSASSPCVAV